MKSQHCRLLSLSLTNSLSIYHIRLHRMCFPRQRYKKTATELRRPTLLINYNYVAGGRLSVFRTFVLISISDIACFGKCNTTHSPSLTVKFSNFLFLFSSLVCYHCCRCVGSNSCAEVGWHALYFAQALLTRCETLTLD